jgi:hypothetical protein
MVNFLEVKLEKCAQLLCKPLQSTQKKIQMNPVSQGMSSVSSKEGQSSSNNSEHKLGGYINLSNWVGARDKECKELKSNSSSNWLDGG